jgi:hypothetical protein
VASSHKLVSIPRTADAFDGSPSSGHHLTPFDVDAIFVEPEYPAVYSIIYRYGYRLRHRSEI